MSEKRILSESELETRRTAHLTHGAGAAEVALTKGTDFTGLAAAQEQRVRDELEVDGIEAIVKRDAIRLQVVADLYYAAILGADTFERLDLYVKRYGWIQSSTLRAWQQLEASQGKADRRDVTELLSGGSDG